jgi:hypothetical protein
MSRQLEQLQVHTHTHTHTHTHKLLTQKHDCGLQKSCNLTKQLTRATLHRLRPPSDASNALDDTHTHTKRTLTLTLSSQWSVQVPLEYLSRYGLDGPGIESRWGRLLYPPSCTSTGCLLRGVKQPERSVNHPHTSSAEVKERVELYLYSPCGPSWPVTGWTLPLPLLV